MADDTLWHIVRRNQKPSSRREEPGCPPPYIFHAFDVSYFSAKVRPALRHERLWVDEVRAELRSSPVARFTGACASWLVQRVLGDYRALDTTDCKQVDEAVAGTGWEAVLAYQPRYRIENRGFDLVLAND